ncbi:delta-8 fatty acid desaturase [Chaetoceros tenuissimus]|uniref:Delta-8 fatty acid desaturase n=1 Tax=Chaetoceros tenuissimus TaxID=426638 RepID=A0AAD3CN74_9STRA|nr:delta-8 fatty acid desaturase [Chaetoceros tenuissimus]
MTDTLNSKCTANQLISSTSSSSLSSSSSTPSFPTFSSLSKSRPITWKELKQHAIQNNPSAELWIALHGKVYNISTFASIHPGGSIIYQYTGRDATDEFDAFHLPRVQKRLPAYQIGVLVDHPQILPITKDYRELKDVLWKEGWFDADWNYYLQKDILALTILTIGIGLMVIGESMIVRVLLGGAAVGLALQQIAFVAHDAGHWGITPPKAGGGINWLGWFHGVVCFGVSIEMWVDEHSGHHAMTMRPHEDPQFKYLPIFLISSKELDRFHELSKVEQVLAKWLVPFQHYTMIPISMIIGRFNLHVISLIYALKSKKIYDVAGLALYFAWFGGVVSLLPTSERLPFVLVAYIVAGILHIQLTISHLATNSFTAEEDEKEQFFAFQCKTTRNIDSTHWDDWFHGGLQFQIEHHLFPQLPRHNLIKVKPLVEKLCKKHGIEYRTTGFFNAVKECLSDFRRLSSFIGDLVHPHEIMPEKCSSSV